MSHVRMPLRVGEVLPAIVRRKLSISRVLISLKGHTLVAEPEREVVPGDEILVQVLAIFPRIRLRLLNSAALPSAQARARKTPLDLQT